MCVRVGGCVGGVGWGGGSGLYVDHEFRTICVLFSLHASYISTHVHMHRACTHIQMY